MDAEAVEESRHEDLEIRLLKDAIYHKYGYDFHAYAHASFKRRLLKARAKHNCKNIADMLHKTLTDPSFFSVLLNDLTVTVTELFRDPMVFRTIREKVVPFLRTYPEIKVWCAGSAAGEEVYSLAILLQEERLYERSILYGTDINPAALTRARQGIIKLETIKKGTTNYFECGGKTALSKYYTANYDAALISATLKKHIVFSDHNLVTDGVFGEIQLIFCRNTLIYFNRELQDRAIGLFRDSLGPGGFLCLGTKESLVTSNHNRNFEEFSRAERIYRVKR